MSTTGDGEGRPQRSVWGRLYYGETNINFIGRWRLWFTISGAVILVGLISLFARGLNLGIDFEGGTVWEVDAPSSVSVADARSAASDAGLTNPEVQTLVAEGQRRVRVSAEPEGNATQRAAREVEVSTALAKLSGAKVDDVNVNSVGPSWGKEITKKAQRALIIFLIAIVLYITIRFEWKMALPTLAALVHDILITVGVYSLFHFEVTPATVVAILTILGYSIYDGIVVFDKIDENTKALAMGGRMTYSEMCNMSLNQVLMRTLNTSIMALLPVLSLLLIGSFVLGAATLQDFALALFVGLASGMYSSIFIASPLLAMMKEREPRWRQLRERLARRAPGFPAAEPALAGASAGGGSRAPIVSVDPGGDGAQRPVPPRPSGSTPAGVIPPRPRKKRRRR